MSSQSTVGVLGFAMPFYQPERIGNKNVGPKLFRSPKLAWFDFSLSNFAVQGHILSTFGDALFLEHLGISSSAHSLCDTAKMFFISKFRYLFIFNLTHKTKTPTTNRWELPIANHLDQLL
jgi:hypothetical protein